MCAWEVLMTVYHKDIFPTKKCKRKEILLGSMVNFIGKKEIPCFRLVSQVVMETVCICCSLLLQVWRNSG